MVGVVAGAEFCERAFARERERFAPAFGFTAGLLWPLAIAVVALWCFAVGSRALARSFAAVWREYL